MRTYKFETQEVEVVDKYTCDSCGKVDDYMEDVLVGHNEWGNDSIESMQTFHFCSSECYYDLLNDYMSEELHRKTAYFDGTLLRRWEYIIDMTKDITTYMIEKKN